MDIDLIFKIAAVGMIVTILNIFLKKADRDDYAFMTTLAGLIVVLVMMANEIGALFDTIKSVFGF